MNLKQKWHNAMVKLAFWAAKKAFFPGGVTPWDSLKISYQRDESRIGEGGFSGSRYWSAV